MITKKPFASLNLMFGQVIFKTGIESFNDDPKFGLVIKTEHVITEPIAGRIDGITRGEDGNSINVTVIPITAEGDDLHASSLTKEAEVINLPLDLDKMPSFAENVWCDDKKRVNALCLKLNSQAEAGLLPLLDLIKGKLDYINSVNTFIKEEEA